MSQLLGAALALLFLLSAELVNGFYLPGVAPQDFKKSGGLLGRSCSNCKACCCWVRCRHACSTRGNALKQQDAKNC